MLYCDIYELFGSGDFLTFFPSSLTVFVCVFFTQIDAHFYANLKCIFNKLFKVPSISLSTP